MAPAQGLCWFQWMSVCIILNPAPGGTVPYFSNVCDILLLQLPNVACVKWPVSTGMQTSAARSTSVVCIPPWAFLQGPAPGEQCDGCCKGYVVSGAVCVVGSG